MDTITQRWIKRGMVWAAWVGLFLNVAVWLLLTNVPLRSLGLVALLTLIQVGGLWLCLGVLAVRYRRWVGTWYGLGAAILALALVRWSVGGGTSDLTSSLLSLGIVGAVAAVPLSLVLLLWQRDVSVVLIGLTTLAFVWGVLLASRPYGDPFRAWLLATLSESGEFWWFDTLSCLMVTALPLGGAAFFLHLLRLVIKELNTRPQAYSGDGDKARGA